MNIWWSLILLPVGFAVAWVTVFRKPTGESIAVEDKYKDTGPVYISRNDPVEHEHHYYGAFVQICSNACDAARDIADKRFLSADAPHFPLPDCDRDECRCIMRPQDDRRAGYNRRGDSFSAYGNFELDRHDQKRDKKKDRRK